MGSHFGDQDGEPFEMAHETNFAYDYTKTLIRITSGISVLLGTNPTGWLDETTVQWQVDGPAVKYEEGSCLWSEG